MASINPASELGKLSWIKRKGKKGKKAVSKMMSDLAKKRHNKAP